jgi:hypothetical protein
MISGLRLTDKNLHKKGFAAFASSGLREGGKVVRFTYPSGVSYDVPVSYIVTWYPDREQDLSFDELQAIHSRRVMEGLFVRIRFSNGAIVYVGSDIVLMSCEPGFEHFGGFTDLSQTLAEKWFSKAGPFRVQ